MSNKNKFIVAILGGDEREVTLANELCANYIVKVFALPEYMLYDGVSIYSNIKSTVTDADMIILPMSGIDEDGKLYAKYFSGEIIVTAEDFSSINASSAIYAGIISNYLKELSDSIYVSLFGIANMDMLAIPNSIPTAEAAINIAMTEMTTTIHSSNCMVLGYGRVGETLANTLYNLGAKVTVVNRDSIQLKKAWVNHLHICSLNDYTEILPKMDIIFNTIPALIMDKKALSKVREDTLIIDLASNHGGIDYEESHILGLKVIHALGLPGKVFPKTAGKILYAVYDEIIKELI